MTRPGLRVPLPRGVIDGRAALVDAEIRPLTGREEELLAAGGVEAMAATVTSLLARCVMTMGGSAVSRDAVRNLSVGDREALLLHLRRATLGDRLDCVAGCPDPACGERLDLALSVGELLVTPDPGASAWYEESFPAPDGEVRVRFRVPTGADQEAVADLAAADPGAAARAILDRCIARVLRPDGAAVPLPDGVGGAIAARMAELDPQAEIRLRFDCAACGRPVDVLFDTAAYFLAELAATAERLEDEVHAIAWHYHWSEGEILGLPRDRRRRYLDRIAASLGRQSRGVA